VERHLSVVCDGQSLKGEKLRIEASELFARVLQHEVDHLDGILVIDRAAPEERKAAIRRYFEYQRAEKL
jgi:peptide deformylase